MHITGGDAAENIQDFFFAENRLRIFNDNGLLSRAALSCFTKKQSYLSECSLNLAFDIFPEYKESDVLSHESGIVIGRMDRERWFFSGSDEKNRCLIVASQDYSALNGYIDIDHSEDTDALKANLLQLLRTATECSLAYHNSVSVHASCIAFNDQSILFIAPSGTGKSTHAKIWESFSGARIISGDRPLLRCLPEETRVYGVPWDGKEQIFLQENFPVKAIVELRRAQVKNSIRRLSAAQAFKIMIQQSFIPMWDDAAKFPVIRTIHMIAKTVPFYRLFCLPDSSAVKLVNDAVFLNKRSVINKEQKDMKIKEGFILKNLMDEWIVMPAGSNIKKFEGAIVLSEVAAFIWAQLEKPICREDLLNSILGEYEVDEQTAENDMEECLNKLRDLNILEEN